MNFCFNGLKSGPICLGDTMAQLHGQQLSGAHIGIGILGLIAVAILIFVFREPA